MRGFSLLEMAIVMMITGLIAGSTAHLYGEHLKVKAVYDTQENFDLVSKGMNAFYGKYGRYPCPASFSKTGNDPGAGEETDCSVPAAVGCNADFCVTTGSGGRTVRIGAVPFKTLSNGLNPSAACQLNANSKECYDFDIVGAGASEDGYGSQFTYAVTEKQATTGYVDKQGAIRVNDESGTAVFQDADFVLVTHGPDRRGSRSSNGVAFPDGCDGAALDGENCDGDAIFISALKNDIAGAAHFDDMLIYRIWMTYFLWERPYDPLNPAKYPQQGTCPNPPDCPYNKSDIFNKNVGNIGVGTNDPVQRLHVKDGNVRTRLALWTDNLCNSAGGDCFEPHLIGGSGISCGGKAVAAQGVSNRVMNCISTIQSSYDVDCGAGSYLTGYTYSGAAKAITSFTCEWRGPP